MAKVRAKEAEPVELTLTGACDRYWDEYAQFLKSHASVQAHLEHLERLIGGGTLLTELHVRRVKAFVAARRKEVSPSTVNRNLSTLRKLMTMAEEDWEVAVARVAIGKYMLPEPTGREVFLTHRQSEDLIQSIVPHARAWVEFALYTGLRKGNLASLTWADVDLEQQRLTVRVKHRHREGKMHAVPLIPRAVELLIKLAPTDEERRGPVFYYGNPHVGCDCAACHKSSRLIGKAIQDPKRAFDTARRSLGLPDVRIHDLRHTVASRLVAKKHSLKVVKDVLGHADIKTSERYAHLEVDALASAMAESLTRETIKPAGAPEGESHSLSQGREDPE